MFQSVILCTVSIGVNSSFRVFTMEDKTSTADLAQDRVRESWNHTMLAELGL